LRTCEDIALKAFFITVVLGISFAAADSIRAGCNIGDEYITTEDGNRITVSDKGDYLVTGDKVGKCEIGGGAFLLRLPAWLVQPRLVATRV
jgi:hypothetical protein